MSAYTEDEEDHKSIITDISSTITTSSMECQSDSDTTLANIPLPPTYNRVNSNSNQDQERGIVGVNSNSNQDQERRIVGVNSNSDQDRIVGRNGGRIGGLGRYRNDLEDVRMREHRDYSYRDNIAFINDLYVIIGNLRGKYHNCEGCEEEISRRFLNLTNNQVHGVFDRHFDKSKFQLLNVLLNVWDENIELENLLTKYDTSTNGKINELQLKLNELDLQPNVKQDLQKIIDEIPTTITLRNQISHISRKIKKN